MSVASAEPHPERIPSRREAWAAPYARRLLVSDAGVLLWSFVAAHVVWAANGFGATDQGPYTATWVVVSVLLFVIWLAALAVAGTRERRILGSGPEEYKRIVRATVLVFAVIAFFGYAFHAQVPRSYVLIALPLGLALLLISRWVWRQWLLIGRQRGEMTTRAVVVGGTIAATHLTASLNRHQESGYTVIGIFLTSKDALPADIGGVPVFGGVDHLASRVIESGAEAVVVAASDDAHPDMVRRLGWDLEGSDVELIVAPSLANIAGPRVHIRPVAGLPLLHVERPAYKGTQRWAKGLFDRAGSLLVLTLVSPLMVLIAILVRATSRGPVFYIQERAGRNGTTFGMLKFRSMVDGADRAVPVGSRDAGNVVMFKMRDDPRVTPVGKVLRRFSLDELPQLFNVLIGDMSLVGPRPPLLSEVDDYEVDARRRLLVRPGITGPWQVSGRSDLPWEETVRLDLYYVENWSIVGDLLILWKTVRAVRSSQGAY